MIGGQISETSFPSFESLESFLNHFKTVKQEDFVNIFNFLEQF